MLRPSACSCPPPSWRAPASRQRALTLVELMVAVALVGVLGTLAVQGWMGWREKVKLEKAQGDLIAISLVVDSHLADTGALPASLADIGRGDLTDPWGRKYRYLPFTGPSSIGNARKNRSLVPINSDYDLFSVGPDGATATPLTARASQDDIIRANNGRFIGSVAHYMSAAH
jgi:general secretion pathway protein G